MQEGDTEPAPLAEDGAHHAQLRRLARLDLNLLVALDALLAEGSVTRAARRVGLSQPAMSRALGRLRVRLADPLFVRDGRGISPTPRALEMAPGLRRLLSDLDLLVHPAVRFDPSTSARTFHVVVPDYGDAVVMPKLLGHLAQHAPGVRVILRNDYRPGGLDWAHLVLAPPVDVVTPTAASPLVRTFRCQHLFDDRFVVVARADHPAIPADGRLDLQTYLALEHVLIDPAEDGASVVDRELARRGRSRRIVLSTPHFSGVAAIARATDLVGVMPERQAFALAQGDRVRLHEPPVPLPKLGMSQYWHPRHDADPAHRWFRGTVRTVGERLAGPDGAR